MITDRSVTHDTFTIQRTYPASPALVFAAFADPKAKARWAGSPGSVPDGDAEGYIEFDFRLGGHERFGFEMPGGSTYSYDAVYYDIVPDRRIVYCYEMYADGARISVSVAAIEFVEGDAGTALTYTEQGAFLDGLDQPELRLEGTTELLDSLAAYLASHAAN
ncbi:MAG: SRPBCC family protein [Mycobacteriales bacterium]